MRGMGYSRWHRKRLIGKRLKQSPHHKVPGKLDKHGILSDDGRQYDRESWKREAYDEIAAYKGGSFIEE